MLENVQGFTKGKDSKAWKCVIKEHSLEFLSSQMMYHLQHLLPCYAASLQIICVKKLISTALIHMLGVLLVYFLPLGNPPIYSNSVAPDSQADSSLSAVVTVDTWLH